MPKSKKNGTANGLIDGEPTFFTVGYEGLSFEDYANRLRRNKVRALCDIRKNPISRKKGFSKSALSEALKERKIHYFHMPELGIESEKRCNLKTELDYTRLLDEYEKSTLKQNASALDRLEALLLEYKYLAIGCFEASHHICHRSRVAEAMRKRPKWKYQITHIK